MTFHALVSIVLSIYIYIYMYTNNNARNFKYHLSSSIEVSSKRWALLTIQFAFCFMHIYIAVCDWLKAQAELNIFLSIYPHSLLTSLAPFFSLSFSHNSHHFKWGNKSVKMTMKFQKRKPNGQKADWK